MVRPRQVSDEQILEIARTSFLADGPGVSTLTIAERIGISQAALFKRFQTKQGLMMAALLPKPGPFIAQIASGPDARPIDAQLLELALELSQFLGRMMPCMAVLLASGIDPEALLEKFDHPPPLLVERAMTGFFERAAKRGQIVGGVEPRALASVFLGSLHFRNFLAHLPGSPTSRATTVRRDVEQLLSVLAPHMVATKLVDPGQEAAS